MSNLYDSPFGDIERVEYTTVVDNVDFLTGPAFDSDEFNDDGIGPRLVRGINITKGKTRWPKAHTKYWKNLTPELKKYLVQEGDILIGMDGSLVGRNFAQVKPEDLPCLLVQRVARLRAKNTINSNYLYQLFASDVWLDYVDIVKTNSGIPHISNGDIKEFRVPAFSLHQQLKIAKTLSTVDNLIEKTQSLVDKYIAVKQGMMADLFTRGIDLTPGDHCGQLRPSITEAPELYQQTELGWVPKDWLVENIEEVSLGGFKNGYFKDPKLVGSGTKLVNVTELYQNFGIDIIPDKVQRIQTSPKDFEKYKVEVGDLLFTRSSLVLEGIAKSNIVRVLPEQAVFECHVMRLKPNKEIVVPEFLALFTGMPRARSYFMSMAKQVTMTTIAQPDMVGLPIPLPSLTEQELIVKKLDAIESLIRKETSTVKKNKEVKKGLMQDLLTGKVRV
jgi:type I restriction enzyme S subunit